MQLVAVLPHEVAHVVVRHPPPHQALARRHLLLAQEKDVVGDFGLVLLIDKVALYYGYVDFGLISLI